MSDDVERLREELDGVLLAAQQEYGREEGDDTIIDRYTEAVERLAREDTARQIANMIATAFNSNDDIRALLVRQAIKAVQGAEG